MPDHSAREKNFSENWYYDIIIVSMTTIVTLPCKSWNNIPNVLNTYQYSQWRQMFFMTPSSLKMQQKQKNKLCLGRHFLLLQMETLDPHFLFKNKPFPLMKRFLRYFPITWSNSHHYYKNYNKNKVKCSKLNTAVPLLYSHPYCNPKLATQKRWPLLRG